jgi:hypothetical protein
MARYNLLVPQERAAADVIHDLAERLLEFMGYNIKYEWQGKDLVFKDRDFRLTTLEFDDREFYVRDSSRDAIPRGDVCRVLDQHPDLVTPYIP